jgi:hypothetical protein
LVSGSSVMYTASTPTPSVTARARSRTRAHQRRTLSPAQVRERRTRAAALRVTAGGAARAIDAAGAAPATAPRAHRSNPEWRRKLRDARRHAAPPGTV